ncbi:hypothetical protein H4S04_008410, partial [Coemansia sp. S16]
PRSTAKLSRKQPVTAPSKTLESYFERMLAANKQQLQQQQLSPPPQPKNSGNGTS